MKVDVSKRKRYRRISVMVFTTAILIPSLISLTKRISQSINSNASTNLAFKKIEVKFENIYSKGLEYQIHAFIKDKTQNSTLLTFDQTKLYTELKSRFKIIKKFECKISSLEMQLKIIGITPFCTVNKSWVLGDKKQLFHANLFDQFNCSNLENISINEIVLKNNPAAPLSKELYVFIKQIPTNLWQSFDINFIKSTEIYLTPKNKDLKYCFVVNQKTINNEPMLEKATELYHKLMHDEKFTKNLQRQTMKAKKNHKLVLDVRFKNRIVTRLESQTGEGGR